MNVFYVIKARKIKQAILLLVAFVFVVSIIFVEKNNVSVFAYDEPAAIYQVLTDQKIVALTFDISWGDQIPGPILDVLKEKNLQKATFFLSSQWSKQYPELVERIVEDGYEIGSHGHLQTNYSELSEEEIQQQILLADRILTQTTGKKPTLIRFPNGDFDSRVLQKAADNGYQVIQWDTDSLDWKNPGVDNIVNRVVSSAHPGDIIFMHASDSSEQTPLALPQIIDQLRKDGFTFVTVSELINNTTLSSNEVRDNQ